MTKDQLDAIRPRCRVTGDHSYKLPDARRDMSALLAEVERLTHERDAAIADAREFSCRICCTYCRFYNTSSYIPPCSTCSDMSNWQWRGAQEVTNEGN